MPIPRQASDHPSDLQLEPPVLSCRHHRQGPGIGVSGNNGAVRTSCSASQTRGRGSDEAQRRVPRLTSHVSSRARAEPAPEPRPGPSRWPRDTASQGCWPPPPWTSDVRFSDEGMEAECGSVNSGGHTGVCMTHQEHSPETSGPRALPLTLTSPRDPPSRSRLRHALAPAHLTEPLW